MSEREGSNETHTSRLKLLPSFVKRASYLTYLPDVQLVQDALYLPIYLVPKTDRDCAVCCLEQGIRRREYQERSRSGTSRRKRKRECGEDNISFTKPFQSKQDEDKAPNPPSSNNGSMTPDVSRDYGF